MFPDLKTLIFLTPPLLLALTIHEFSHGLAAYALGDPTPKLYGRLSMNPLKHLDPLGTIALFLTQAIGWAKPVPINPNYFKNPWRDMALVSLAGPVSNILLAFVFGLLFNFFESFNIHLGGLQISEPMALMCYLGVKINIGLGIFNLLPIPPLDGSKVIVKFLPYSLRADFLRFELIGFIIIIVLAVTGLLSWIIYPIISSLSSLVFHLTSFF